MENLKTATDKFLSIYSDYRYDSLYCSVQRYGHGYGYGHGFGYGDRSGNGNGYGDGGGNGYGGRGGDGYGNGDIYGYLYGRGDGYGDKHRNGDGYGDGDGISQYDNDNVYLIDGIQTIIKHIHGNIAEGFILNSDLTLTHCYVVKQDNKFAHGKTIHEAEEALRSKIFANLSDEERIDAFCAEFNITDRYPATTLFEWHHRLTGSCLMGREAFCRDRGIDVDNSSFTVAEFYDKTRHSYRGELIEKMWKQINKKSRKE